MSGFLFFPLESRQGFSLLELLVSLLLLQLTGVALLAGLLTAERAHRAADLAGRVDLGRWQTYRNAEAAPGCRGGDAGAVAVTLPAEGARVPLALVLDCTR